MTNALNIERPIDLDLEFVKEKTIFFDVEGTSEEFNVASTEFKKFLTLVKKYPGPFAIPSKKVDDVWHAFMLFSSQYRKFCENTYGKYIDHQPNTAQSPVPLSALTNFYRSYEEEYGNVPAIWYEDYDQNTAQQLKNHVVPDNFSKDYRWSGWPG